MSGPTDHTKTHDRRIDHADQLPLRSYTPGSTGTAILDDETGLLALARSVKSDLEEELEAFEMADPGVAKGHHHTLAGIAMLEGEDDAVIRHLDEAAGLEAKPAPRLLTGLLERSILDARGEAGAAFGDALGRRLRALPYNVVSSDLRGVRAACQVSTDPIVRADLANHLGGSRATLDREAAARVLRTLPEARALGRPLMQVVHVDDADRLGDARALLVNAGHRCANQSFLDFLTQEHARNGIRQYNRIALGLGGIVVDRTAFQEIEGLAVSGNELDYDIVDGGIDTFPGQRDGFPHAGGLGTHVGLQFEIFI